MYRERLVATEVHSENAHRLKRLLLEYHDFRQLKTAHPLLDDARRLADWQAERLKTTHHDLYRHPGYHTGLEFLLTDLYAPAGDRKSTRLNSSHVKISYADFYLK